MPCSYQGNALLKIGPETPQTTSSIKIKEGIISSDSQDFITAYQAISLHPPAPFGLSAGPSWSHGAVDITCDPVLNPPCLFVSWWDTVRQLHLSSVIMALLPFYACLPSLQSHLDSHPCHPAPPTLLPSSQPPKCSRQDWLWWHLGPSLSTDQADALSIFQGLCMLNRKVAI